MRKYAWFLINHNPHKKEADVADQATEHESLPDDVRPSSYALHLVPDLAAGTFTGTVTIEALARLNVSEIVLNAAEMEITGATVAPICGDPWPVPVTNIALDERTERLTLTLQRPLPVGPINIRIDFKGKLGDRMVGFYLSKYKAPDGTERLMASTQFEAHHARRCFPCWDQPDCKATFKVTLTVPDDLTALSNGRVAGLGHSGDGTKTVSFEKTPKMSTYLLAFVVGEMDFIEGRTDDGVAIRVWTTPGKAEQGRFALDVTRRCLAYFDEAFGVPYRTMMPSVQLAAIPDFAFGAMENWGLITFREIALLVEEGKTSEATKRRVAEIVCHELAHQWFGNYVTMEWWGGLWLNESFATWMAYKAVHHLFPEWDVLVNFVADEMSRGFDLDGLASTHPIEVPVPRAADVDEVFDAISYSKGGSVLRMLERFVGEDGFLAGLRLYMRRHAYGNARSADLWNAIGEACPDQPVAGIMRAWTSRAGHPVIRVSSVWDKREGDTLLACRQERFYLTGPNPEDMSEWPVPMVLSIEGGAPESLLLKERLGLDVIAGEVTWLQANVERGGFYRVLYDGALRRGITAALDGGMIASPEERFALQDDAAALAFAGLAPATNLLEIAEASRGEEQTDVWRGLLTSLGNAGRLLSWDQDTQRLFRAFMRGLLADATARVGWDKRDGESPNVAQLRGLVLGSAAAYGDNAVIDEAMRRFRTTVSGEPLDPDLRGIVYGAAARNDGDRGYDDLLALYRASTSSEEKVAILYALGQTPLEALKRHTLAFALSDEVRKQDAITAVAAVASGPLGTRLAWEFIRDNWGVITERYRGNNMKIAAFAKLAGRLALPNQLKDAETFFAAHPVDGMAMTVEQVLESIRVNIAWRERHAADVAAWLTARNA